MTDEEWDKLDDLDKWQEDRDRRAQELTDEAEGLLDAAADRAYDLAGDR